MPFNQMLNDRFSLLQNGRLVKEGIKGVVADNKIITFDIEPKFQKNDLLLRALPNGLEEIYVIDDPKFNTGMGGIKSFFEIAVHKSNQQPDTKANIINNYNTTHNTITGNNNNININSPGSTFINNSTLFDSLKSVIEQQIPEKEKEKLLAIVDRMSKSQTKDDYISCYNTFIQAIANHMSILSPFIPQLSTYLSG